MVFDRSVRIGHLAFGAAFLVIGVSWLVADHHDASDIAWIAAVTTIAIGVAGLVTILTRLFR